jgi:hypothetical protein
VTTVSLFKNTLDGTASGTKYFRTWFLKPSIKDLKDFIQMNKTPNGPAMKMTSSHCFFAIGRMNGSISIDAAELFSELHVGTLDYKFYTINLDKLQLVPLGGDTSHRRDQPSTQIFSYNQDPCTH